MICHSSFKVTSFFARSPIDGGGRHEASVGVEDIEAQHAAVVVVVAYLYFMYARAQGLLTNLLVGTLGLVVVDHHVAVNLEQAAVVALQGEGVDTIDGHDEIAADDEADMPSHRARDYDIVDGVDGSHGTAVHGVALESTEVIPRGSETVLERGGC